MNEISPNESQKKFYIINWIKQIWDRSEKINMIIDWKSEEEIKDVINKHLKIIILWMSIYTWANIKEFWRTIFKFNYEWEEYTWVTTNWTIIEAYNFLTKILKLKLTYINDNQKVLEEEKVIKVLEELKKRAQQEEEQLKIENEKRKEKKKLDEPALLELKRIINEEIAEAEELSERIMWIITTSEMKMFKDTIGDLKKLRMSRNSENLVEILEKLMEMSEKFEEKYTEYMKNKEIWNLQDTTISNLDIVWEYKKFKKSEKVVKVWKIGKIEKSIDDVYYNSFGKKWIYYRLIWKEIKNRILKLDNFLSGFYKYSELFIIFILLDLTIYIIYPYLMKAIWSWDWNLEKLAVYYYLWNFWLLGLIIFGMKFIKKDNLIKISIIYILTIISFVLLNRFIVYNFAF